MTNPLRKAFQFHLAHGGYCTPPGRAVCALSSAKAELAVRELVADDRASFEWIYDIDVDLSWMTDAERERDHECMGCVLKIDGIVADSLWGIVDADANYRRTIEAELACEGLSVIREREENELEGVLTINALTI